MVNFTHAPSSRLVATTNGPRRSLVVQWDSELGMVVGLATRPGQSMINPPGLVHKMDLVNLICVSAQRGGLYAR